jgi:hypothetical protein
MFGARKLPPTVNAVFYLKARPAVAAAVAKLDAGDAAGVAPSVKLLHRWCRDAPTDDVLRGCMKLIGNGRNFAEVGAPSFVQSYNGKPVLLAGGGLGGNRLGISQIYRGANYLEIDIDVAAHFTFLSQRGICWMLNYCDRLVSDLGFVIEGRTEAELPECLLGCVTLVKMPVLKSVNEATMFGAVYSSQERAEAEAGPGGN